MVSGKAASCDIAVLVWCCWRLWRFTISPRLYPTRPKTYPYMIPFVGHLPSFLMDSNTLVTRARTYFKNTRAPFALILGGETMYIITSAKDATAVFKHVNELTFDAYVEDLHKRFGMTPTGVKAMWTKPTPDFVQARLSDGGFPNPNRKSVHAVGEAIVKTQLVPGAALEKLSASFLGTICERLAWDKVPDELILERLSGGEERVVSPRDITRNVLLYSATKALFGEAIFKIDPHILDYYATFDKDSWQFSYSFPAVFAKKMYEAKDKTQGVLEKYFELPMAERADVSWMVSTMEAEFRAVGLNSTDIAALFMMIYWVTNSNVWKITFWLISHILADADLKTNIKEELSPLFSTGSSTSIDAIDRHLSQCPTLIAAYHESLRVCTASVSVRMVDTDCVINNVRLSKGAKLIIPYRQMAMDQTVFGAYPEQFNHTRFLDQPALAKDPSFRPFGGGTTYCPGRFMAQKATLMVVAMVVGKYSAQLTGGDQRLPNMEMTKPSLGVMEPRAREDFQVVLKKA